MKSPPEGKWLTANLGCKAVVHIVMAMCLVYRYQREAEAARRSAAEDKQRLEFQLASMRVCYFPPSSLFPDSTFVYAKALLSKPHQQQCLLQVLRCACSVSHSLHHSCFCALQKLRNLLRSNGTALGCGPQCFFCSCHTHWVSSIPCFAAVIVHVCLPPMLQDTTYVVQEPTPLYKTLG